VAALRVDPATLGRLGGALRTFSPAKLCTGSPAESAIDQIERGERWAPGRGAEDELDRRDAAIDHREVLGGSLVTGRVAVRSR
jgi:hypothetical protein